MTAVPQPAADRASAYGLERILIDGNDADVVYRTAQTAFDKARAGEGPSLIECLDLSSQRALARRPGKVSARRRTRPLEAARSDQDLSRAVAAIRRRRKGDRRDRRGGAQDRRRRDRGLQGRATAAARYHHHRCLCRWRLGMAELTYRDAVIRGIAQEMTSRSRRRVSWRGRGQGRWRVQGDRRPLRAVRTVARARHADFRAGDPRRRDGRGDDRPEADRRDHVLGFLRGLLRLHRQRISEKPLHVERPGQVPAGRAHRQRRRIALRRAAQPERRELVHDDPRPQGRRAFEPARCHRPAGGFGARSRSGDFPRAQVALSDQGRSSGRRDRRHVSAPPKFCAPARTPPSALWH